MSAFCQFACRSRVCLPECTHRYIRWCIWAGKPRPYIEYLRIFIKTVQKYDFIVRFAMLPLGRI